MSMTKLVCLAKKMQIIFLGKHYGVKLNYEGRGGWYGIDNQHFDVVFEEFEFFHRRTIHKLVHFHGGSKCRWVIVTLVFVDVQET